jgi:hypothetical protein
MSKLKNSRGIPSLPSFLGMRFLFPLGLVIVIVFCPLLNWPESVQGRGNQDQFIEPEDLEGTWTWHTNPMRNPQKESPKWSGSFTIMITEEDKRVNGFSGSYGDGTKIEHGRFGRTGLIWHRMTGKDPNDPQSSDQQTWTVDKIEFTRNGHIKMWGRWRGAFDKCCENKGDDFEFVAYK